MHRMQGFGGTALYCQDDFVVLDTLHICKSENEGTAVTVAYTLMGRVVCLVIQVCSVLDSGGLVWVRASCLENGYSSQDRELIGDHHAFGIKERLKRTTNMEGVRK